MNSDFIDTIMNLEDSDNRSAYIVKIGRVPVLFTAVHTMEQFKKDGTFKLSEPFTKAIARYVSTRTETSYFIKVLDNGIDSNQKDPDEFKEKMIEIIKEHNIKLLIDLHGASEEREFDVEFGTLNNMSIDYSTVKSLEDSFKEQGINNVIYNNPFKGGGITRYVYEETNVDVVQIEINRRFRNVEYINNIEKICNALIEFVKKYSKYH